MTRQIANYPDFEDVRQACEGSMFGTDNSGFCLACGETQDGCEPDARGYECESCGEHEVFGAEECLMMGAYQQRTRKRRGKP